MLLMIIQKWLKTQTLDTNQYQIAFNKSQLNKGENY